MRLKHRAPSLHDRVVWQCASLLLSYPDGGHCARLDMVEELSAPLEGEAQKQLRRAIATLRALDAGRAAIDYVETFDLRHRCTMYLTYWTAGDTRNRGAHMLAFAHAYREAGVSPPNGEAPDHLPVVLEFAATVDPEAGRRLLTQHRVAIDLLRDALTEAGSAYADVVGAVCRTLPKRSDQDVRQARQLAQCGPPTESVGLQPFTLTVPPRRSPGGA
jgi:nitrate reductase delta subunit